MRPPSDSLRSTRANNDTCPRAIAFRIASRTSPSHFARSLGSLMDGLKNRWFTERISTETRAAPTVPSADPNPVMLLIMFSLPASASHPERAKRVKGSL
jgi:hypothetical protein